MLSLRRNQIAGELLAREQVIGIDPLSLPDPVTFSISLRFGNAQFGADFIQRALEQTGGNRTTAAKLLEISHRALLYKIRAYFPEAGDEPETGDG